MEDITQPMPETGLPEDLAALEVAAPEENFYPDSAEKVDWVLGKVADRRARAARIRVNAEAIARYEEAQAENLLWHYGPALQAFVREETAGTKRKSTRLFHGVLGFRTKPAGVIVGDPEAALAWAKDHLPEAVSERVDKTALSKALLSSGEVVDFAAFTPAEEEFYVK